MDPVDRVLDQVGSDRGWPEWFAPAVLVLTIQIIALTTVAAIVHYYSIPPLLSYLGKGAIFSILGGSVQLFVTVWLMFRRGQNEPLMELRRRLIENRHRIVVFLVGFSLMLMQLAMLTWAKCLLPFVTTYWADPGLARLDANVFGDDPIRLAHRLPVGQLVDLQYATFIAWTMTAIWLSLLKRNGARGTLSFFILVAILGVCLMFALPSAGPIYFERLGYGARFADIQLQEYARLFSDYLWSQLKAEHISFGAGISAMPSMHVALTAWAALVLGTYGRWQAAAGWIYCSLTWFGSVYLGWHYASDGAVGAASALLIWYCVTPTMLSVWSNTKVNEPWISSLVRLKVWKTS